MVQLVFVISEQSDVGMRSAYACGLMSPRSRQWLDWICKLISRSQRIDQIGNLAYFFDFGATGVGITIRLLLWTCVAEIYEVICLDLYFLEVIDLTRFLFQWILDHSDSKLRFIYACGLVSVKSRQLSEWILRFVPFCRLSSPCRGIMRLPWSSFITYIPTSVF